jgi:hypothetical protein
MKWKWKKYEALTQAQTGKVAPDIEVAHPPFMRAKIVIFHYIMEQ